MAPCLLKGHSLLTSQGWRGSGHSLHKTDDAVGLAKPLLLAQKTDRRGLGTTQHFTSDQWWLNAFDEQLKGLDTSQEGKISQTITCGKLNSIGNGSLGKYYVYSSFVRGGLLEGTIPASLQGEHSSAISDKKRREAEADLSRPIKESKEARRKRKEEKRRQKEKKRLRKEGRRLRREAKQKRRAEQAQKKLAVYKHKAGEPLSMSLKNKVVDVLARSRTTREKEKEGHGKEEPSRATRTL